MKHLITGEFTSPANTKPNTNTVLAIWYHFWRKNTTCHILIIKISLFFFLYLSISVSTGGRVEYQTRHYTTPVLQFGFDFGAKSILSYTSATSYGENHLNDMFF